MLDFQESGKEQKVKQNGWDIPWFFRYLASRNRTHSGDNLHFVDAVLAHWKCSRSICVIFYYF